MLDVHYIVVRHFAKMTLRLLLWTISIFKGVLKAPLIQEFYIVKGMQFNCGISGSKL